MVDFQISALDRAIASYSNEDRVAYLEAFQEFQKAGDMPPEDHFIMKVTRDVLNVAAQDEIMPFSFGKNASPSSVRGLSLLVLSCTYKVVALDLMGRLNVEPVMPDVSMPDA